MKENLNFDVIIIGTGCAGLSTALGCEGKRVALVSKATLDGGANSWWAQGGMAAAIGLDDSPALHYMDTLAAGAGLSDPEATDILTKAAPGVVEALNRLGARFDRDEHGEIELGREAAHQRKRVLHAHGDATGAELMRSLVCAVRELENLTLFEHTSAIELLVDVNGAAQGIRCRREGNDVNLISPAVVFATGGTGQLYRYTTNPREATGDGLAIAAVAGARLMDLEFVQFHPTALLSELDPLPLITEAIRGEGALLVDEDGERFMRDIHPQAELAPRDVVAAGVWGLLNRGGRAFLDARTVVGAAFPEKFPTVFKQCMNAGIDPRTDLMPIAPAAHYHMGGIAVDLDGRSSVPGLWACGEVAATGLHGANRLASNSLIEAIVFGTRVASSICGTEFGPTRQTESHSEDEVCFEDPMTMRWEMWNRVGIVRDGEGLRLAEERFRHWTRRSGGMSRFRPFLGWAMAVAARQRKESRGAQNRTDYPDLNPELQRHSFVSWNRDQKTWTAEFELEKEVQPI